MKRTKTDIYKITGIKNLRVVPYREHDDTQGQDYRAAEHSYQVMMAFISSSSPPCRGVEEVQTSCAAPQSVKTAR